MVNTDGIHINWIEGIFGSVKKMMRKYDTRFKDVQQLELYLAEFVFRYSFEAWDRRKSFIKILFAFKKNREKLNAND
ncbi:hypothetical protein H312_01491 [Anncaliia algerae PRA339]|uniref:Uncharacterized protein n=1 Tax=Anncaliia algerae PRA339 TaxID=1288291 RepID=A0A059F1W7_9MICR|nr:hypothetical protein H312_01491 [Anncaliia algerae PRA339]